MGHSDDQDQQDLVLNLVDHAEVTDSKAIDVLGTVDLRGPMRAGVMGKGVDRGPEAFLYRGIEISELPVGGS